MADPRTVSPSRIIQKLASLPGFRTGLAGERSAECPKDGADASKPCQKNAIVSIPSLVERSNRRGRSLADL